MITTRVLLTAFQVWGGVSSEMEPDGARPRRPQGEALHRAGGGAVGALLPGDDRVQAAAHLG